jgi:hypothetical protein
VISPVFAAILGGVASGSVVAAIFVFSGAGDSEQSVARPAPRSQMSVGEIDRGARGSVFIVDGANPDWRNGPTVRPAWTTVWPREPGSPSRAGAS